MELVLIDKDFQSLAILDTFESLIWTDRYFEPGDFKITTYASTSFLTYIGLGRYLWLKDSEHLMIVENIWIHSDSAAGNTVILEGNSAESILDRRIVWGQLSFSGSFQNLILRLLTDAIISPTDAARAIPNFIFEASTDPAITSLNVTVQYVGENLLKAIEDLCVAANVGFKITLSESGQFVFKLYSGTNRSYSQSVNPYVVFAPEFDNIVNSDYKLSSKTLKTVALVAGEGEGANRTIIGVSVPGGSAGLERREIYEDAGDISRNVEGGTLTDEEYIAQLTQRGAEVLAKNQATQTFEGQVNPNVMYEYNKDFFLGDVVQVADEYKHESESRVVEVIYCQDSSGIRTFPTFASVNNVAN